MPKDDDKDEQKTERFNMFMSPSEMKAIDEWAWEKRIRSKSEAVRRLVHIGLGWDQAADQVSDAARDLFYAIHSPTKTATEVETLASNLIRVLAAPTDNQTVFSAVTPIEEAERFAGKLKEVYQPDRKKSE